MSVEPRIGVLWSAGKNPHIEQLRLAVFGWAVANVLGGEFVLILDNGAQTAAWAEPLEWLTLDWDATASADAIQSSNLTHLVVLPKQVDRGQQLVPSAERIPLPAWTTPSGDALPRRDRTGGYLLNALRQSGCLPRAIFNFVLLAGWPRPKDNNLLSKWDVYKQFQLAALSNEPIIFDWELLRQLNQHYIGKLSNEALAQLLRDPLEDAYGGLPMSERWLVGLTSIVRARLVVLDDVVELAEWAFDPAPEPSAEAAPHLRLPLVRPLATYLIAELATVVLVDSDTAHAIVTGVYRHFSETSQQQIDAILQAILARQITTAPIHAMMGLLGKQRCLERCAAALHAL